MERRHDDNVSQTENMSKKTEIRKMNQMGCVLIVLITTDSKGCLVSVLTEQ